MIRSRIIGDAAFIGKNLAKLLFENGKVELFL